MMFYVTASFLSLFFALMSLFCKSLLVLSFFFEISSLILLACFFLPHQNLWGSNLHRSVTTFFVVSGLAGVLLFSGWLLKSSKFLILALMLKMGLFPFSGWLFEVYPNSKFLILLVLNTIYKLPVLFICFMSISFVKKSYFEVMIVSSFLFSVWYFIFSLNSWMDYLICKSVVSSCVLLIASLALGLEGFMLLLLLTWGFLISLLFFVLVPSKTSWGVQLTTATTLKFSFFLFAFPFSLAIIYKIWTVSCLISFGSLIMFVFWWFYQLTEQVFLLVLLGQESILLKTHSEVNMSRLV